MEVTWYEIAMMIGLPSIIVFLFTFLFNYLVGRNKNNREDSRLLKLGLQALLRDRLMDGYKHFKKQGWIEVAEKENYDNMYKNYHGLGQNGVMDGMYAEIMALPTTKPEPKKRPKKLEE